MPQPETAKPLMLPRILKVPDLTDPALLKDRTDGELFYIIKNGHDDMPPEGGRAPVEGNSRDLVNYVGPWPGSNHPAEQKPSD